VATFSHASGMLIWPPLIGIAMALRLSAKLLMLYVFTGLTAIAAYFANYHSPPHHASPLASLRHPLLVIEYVAKYFGSSFPLSEQTLALPIGLAALLLSLALLIWAVRRGQIRQPIPAILVGLMCFSLMTAAVTALGRINFGTDQAFASRYQTFALVFWFCLAGMLLLQLSQTRIRSLTTLFLTLIVVIMIGSATRYRACLHKAIDRQLWATVPAIALMTEVPDYEGLKGLYPSPDIPWRYAGYLRDRQLSIFSIDSYRQLHKPLGTAYPLSSDKPCSGNVESLEQIAIPGTDSIGLRISGWGVDGRSRWPVHRVIVASEGNIVGFAEPGFFRPDLRAALSSRGAARSGWRGYATVPAGTTSLQFYGVVKGREICPITSVRLAR
jgi:hypothetical protein